MTATGSAARARNIDLDTALADAEARYIAANPKSKAHYERAAQTMPGGNTRTGMHFGPFPFVVEKAQGATVWDVDGHAYRDFVGDFSAGLFGHSHPVIKAAISEAMERGMALGAASVWEAQLSQLVCERVPSMERVRFCNSGTEANTFALLTARAITGRDGILVFEGGYHGGSLSFPPGGNALNLPFPTTIGNYNDAEGARALIEKHRDSLCAVLVEPMQGAGGAIPGSREFLQTLRDACTEHGVILIFDEVICSRLSGQAMQGMLGILPDMTTLGKYVGGGMAFGAFGGGAEIMDRFDPAKPGAFVHNGTFNNNVIMLAAGAAGLGKIYTPEKAAALNASGDMLRERLNALGQKRGVPLQVTGLGSVLHMHLQKAPITAPGDLRPVDPKLRALMHLDLIEKGIFATRRGMMVLSLAIEDEDHDALAGAIDEFLATYGSLLPADA